MIDPKPTHRFRLCLISRSQYWILLLSCALPIVTCKGIGYFILGHHTHLVLDFGSTKAIHTGSTLTRASLGVCKCVRLNTPQVLMVVDEFSSFERHLQCVSNNLEAELERGIPTSRAWKSSSPIGARVNPCRQ